MPVSTQLTITVDARYVTAMGYGNVWNAFDNAAGRMYAGRFRTGRDEQAVKLTLTSLPEMPAALEGFVAGDGTIWQIVTVDAR